MCFSSRTEDIASSDLQSLPGTMFLICSLQWIPCFSGSWHMSSTMEQWLIVRSRAHLISFFGFIAFHSFHITSLFGNAKEVLTSVVKDLVGWCHNHDSKLGGWKKKISFWGFWMGVQCESVCFHGPSFVSPAISQVPSSFHPARRLGVFLMDKEFGELMCA